MRVGEWKQESQWTILRFGVPAKKASLGKWGFLWEVLTGKGLKGIMFPRQRESNGEKEGWKGERGRQSDQKHPVLKEPYVTLADRVSKRTSLSSSAAPFW